MHSNDSNDAHYGLASETPQNELPQSVANSTFIVLVLSALFFFIFTLACVLTSFVVVDGEFGFGSGRSQTNLRAEVDIGLFKECITISNRFGEDKECNSVTTKKLFDNLDDCGNTPETEDECKQNQQTYITARICAILASILSGLSMIACGLICGTSTNKKPLLASLSSFAMIATLLLAITIVVAGHFLSESYEDYLRIVFKTSSVAVYSLEVNWGVVRYLIAAVIPASFPAIFYAFKLKNLLKPHGDAGDVSPLQLVGYQ